MKKALLLLAAVAMFATVACTKVVEKEVQVEVEKIIDILTLNAAQVQVPNKAVEQPISFTTTDAWTIASDAEWITFDKTSGAAGSNTVTMKVAKSEVYSTRTGRVTLSTSHDGTTKSTVFTLVQSEKEVFNTTVDLRVDYTAQNIEIAWTSNLTPEVKVVEGSWLTVAQTKAEPQDGKIVIAVAANEELDSRVGSFTVAAGGNLQTYNVLQASEYAAASSATAYFLGNIQQMYDNSTYAFDNHAQFAVLFATAEGDVTLAFNVDPAIEDVTKLPAGNYVMDESATFAPGTYSIKSSNPGIRYYTSVANGDKEMEIIDGTISVTETGGVYAIVAELTDLAGANHLYSYKGELVATDASLGAEVYDAVDNGLYNTYYSTKVNETKLGLHINKALPGSDHWFSYVAFSLFTNSDEGVLAPGKYTFAVPENDATLGYANGCYQAAANTFYMTSIGKIDWESGVSYAVKEGTTPTLEVTSLGGGFYTIAVDMTVTRTVTEGEASTSEDVPFKATFANVYVPALSPGMKPYPDGDMEFTEVMSSYWMPFWYGDAFNTGCKAFTFGWNNIHSNYSIQLAINVKDDEWEFTKNFSNRYCSTLFKLGTFPFVATPAENTLVPVKSYHHVKNAYTGHTYVINGGSITLTETSVTYDLSCTYNGATYHVGGTQPAAMYYIRDYSTRTLTLDEM